MRHARVFREENSLFLICEYEPALLLLSHTHTRPAKSKSKVMATETPKEQEDNGCPCRLSPTSYATASAAIAEDFITNALRFSGFNDAQREHFRVRISLTNAKSGSPHQKKRQRIIFI